MCLVRRNPRFGQLLGLILASLPTAHAQVSTGTILGSVQDPSGASIVGAMVRVTNTGTGVTQSGASSKSVNLGRVGVDYPWAAQDATGATAAVLTA
jgi:hypothetical protein